MTASFFAPLWKGNYGLSSSCLCAVNIVGGFSGHIEGVWLALFSLRLDMVMFSKKAFIIQKSMFPIVNPVSHFGFLFFYFPSLHTFFPPQIIELASPSFPLTRRNYKEETTTKRLQPAKLFLLLICLGGFIRSDAPTSLPPLLFLLPRGRKRPVVMSKSPNIGFLWKNVFSFCIL